MTDDQKTLSDLFRKSGGSKCPHCNSVRLTHANLQDRGAVVYADTTCGGCQETWLTVWQLSGIEPLTSG